ncbi:methyl-accepting chemotaxis protein [Oceanobacillus salinisoli]|uniref:methyl-accepting chemotaxis protein n=1 Tax=Oceanobacillus salinisoli TaxID=2678611 RepID=UPI0018CC14FB|nr:methyl-accepting chemotaxis protein [Oceanobacillus salinisoli]
MKNKRYSSNLFVKMSSIFLICLLVPMIIIFFYTTKSSTDALESEASSSLSRLAMEKKNQIDMVFDQQFKISDAMVKEIATIDFFEEVFEEEDIDEMKRNAITNNIEDRLANSDGLYENIFYSYDDKVFIDAIGGGSVGHVFDTESEAYYYEQLDNPGVSASGYLYSPATGRPVVAVSNSIMDEQTEEIMSVLVISVDINKLTEDLAQGSSEQNVNTMILDGSGLVIASDQAEYVLDLNFSEENGLQSFYQTLNVTGSGQARFSLDGVENIASFEKNEKYGLYVVSYMPVQQYMSKIDGLESGIFTVGLISLVIAIVLVLFFIRSIVKPIKLVSNTAKQIASGNLTIEKIDIKNNDEIGEMAGSFNQMLSSLRAMVEQLRLTSEKVAASAEEFTATSEQSSEVSQQVAEAIQQVAAGAEEQAQNAASSSEMVKEVSSGVWQVSTNTQKVADFASQTTEKANSGAESVYSSVSEIESINENFQDVAVKVKSLGERSKEIGKIVEVITGIAEQTNLLALNAAIEAARAGVHGRGFAVVADEVRLLAEQSKESSNQIKELVQAILGETEQTVLSVDHTVQKSSQGIEAIKSVEHTFDDIQTSVRQVTDQIQEVSSATQQMSAAIDQITSNIEQINSISTETASQTQEVSSAVEEQLASSEEIAASANEMAKMSEELHEMLRKFKI